MFPPSKYNPLLGKRQRLAVSSSVVAFDAANYIVPEALDGKTGKRTAQAAVLQVGVDALYYTLDGSTPSSTVGFEAAAGDIISIDSHQKIATFKAIRKTGDTTVEALFLF